ASETLYTTSYFPTVEVSTSPETSIASDTSPSTSSSAVAPGSSYVSPTSNSIGLSPFKEITGATVSSGSGSSTVTVARTLSPFGVQVAGKSPTKLVPIWTKLSPATISTSCSPAVKLVSLPPTINATKSSLSSCGVSGIVAPEAPTTFSV